MQRIFTLHLRLSDTINKRNLEVWSKMKENKNLEFKSAVTNSFLKTVSAYSNFGEGMILFGVNDDGSVCGIKIFSRHAWT